MKIKNRRIVRHALCIMLAVLMLLAAAPLTVSAEEANTYKTGDIVEFGSYPQSEVTDETLKTALTAAAGSTDGWTSYDYYIKGVQSDFMKYTDVEYDGENYRGVYFTKYRPRFTDDIGSDNNSYQDDNGYVTSTVYWFKFEPLEWQVLSYDSATDEAVVLSKSVIDSRQYYNNSDNRTIDGVTVYSNNYEHSDIRTWLNDTFYNTTFGTSEKNAIVATTLDNSAYSTSSSEYDSNSTTDNVWLLSYSEVQDTAYGFATGEGNTETRRVLRTAYAGCQGLNDIYTNAYSSWRLRSAGDYFNNACVVSMYGSIVYDYTYVNTTTGVRPALTLSMADAIKPTEPTTEPTTADTDGTTEKDECNHICHKKGIAAFFYKIARFFWKMFKINKACDCGIDHY